MMSQASREREHRARSGRASGDLLLRRMLRPVPRAVPQARQAVADALHGVGFPEWPATLLVSELAANAVDHARTQFEISVVLTDRLHIEVRDGSPGVPIVRPVDVNCERGRGLQLVDRVATDWGIHTGRRGKTVWFDLDASATA
jgi:anti-sigma regulatory factor (Ser/Thr protein kinase)